MNRRGMRRASGFGGINTIGITQLTEENERLLSIIDTYLTSRHPVDKASRESADASEAADRASRESGRPAEPVDEASREATCALTNRRAGDRKWIDLLRVAKHPRYSGRDG